MHTNYPHDVSLSHGLKFKFNFFPIAKFVIERNFVQGLTFEDWSQHLQVHV